MNLPWVLGLERFENPGIGRFLSELPFLSTRCQHLTGVKEIMALYINMLSKNVSDMLFFELGIHILNEYVLREQNDYSLFLCIQTQWLLNYIVCEIYLTEVCTCKLFSSIFYSTFFHCEFTHFLCFSHIELK